ncbi:serine--tRNA synthetase-like protein Slimp [Aplysia californica]|uniref:Serine--tRNA synthetase-like protein Slimp n=1 Tax=Aplysia californica TaxID=6500 RepID=A0ABM0JPU2_APLCA|nr:serine--tRNA synthetase-like protein Slimp [Aplysia californica]XP_035825734.1 serine--tRNA synthetase-like protein Slimp [Aplysia californica]
MASVKSIAQRFHLRSKTDVYRRCLSLRRPDFLFETVRHLTSSPLGRTQDQRRTHCPQCVKARLCRLRTSYITRNFSSKSVFDNQPPSWLFVSGAVAGAYGAQVNLELGLNERLTGEPLRKLQENISARKMELRLDELIQDYNRLLQLKREREELIAKRNELFQQIRALKSQGKSSVDTESLYQEAVAVKQRIKNSVNQAMWDLEESVTLRGLKLPNELHESTPLSDASQILQEKEGTREPQSMNHVEAGEKHELIKFSNVGPKAYYLKGELAIAEQALAELICGYMEKKDYRLIAGPEFFKTPVLEGCGRDVFDTEGVLTIQHVIKDIVEPMNHLAGVSPMTFAAYMAKLCVGDARLPFNLFSCGRTYQNSDLPGLFGAMQTTQVGLFSGVTESDVDLQFEQTIDVVWKLLQSLGFSMRLSLVPVTDLRQEERRRVELQVFAPSLDSFIPIGYVSDLGDFVSRRLMTCHNRNHGDIRRAKHLHMISGSAVNITSLLAVWLEHTDLDQMGIGL